MRGPAWLNLAGDRLWSVPMLILYLTDRCNSRCISCGYWASGNTDLSRALEDQLVGELDALGVRGVLLSGGEAMLHPRWAAIAARLRAGGSEVWLLTHGLMLHREVEAVVANCRRVIVSLDAADGDTYHRIRGVRGFDAVCRGVRAVAARGMEVTLRCTVQAGNYAQLPAIAELASELGATLSFLAADTVSDEAFGRTDGPDGVALDAAAVRHFGALVDGWRASGVLDGPHIEGGVRSVSRIHRFFSACVGLDDWPPVRCNAPRFSAVVESDGRVRPCFFLPVVGRIGDGSLAQVLDSSAARGLRRQQVRGERAECARCVCWLYRGPRSLARGSWPA